MMFSQLTRRLGLAAAGTAVIAMGTLTSGCSSNTKEAPTTPTSTSSAPPVSSTEKVVPQKPLPSIEDRGGMDSQSCGPGQSKVNGVCQPG